MVSRCFRGRGFTGPVIGEGGDSVHRPVLIRTGGSAGPGRARVQALPLFSRSQGDRDIVDSWPTSRKRRATTG